MKQTGLLTKMIILLVAVLLVGCAGRGDWDCELINDYCLIRSNAHTIRLCHYRDQEKGISDIVLERFYVTAIAVSDPYVGLEGIPTAERAASDEELNSTSEQYKYYLLDCQSGSLYGPFSKAEFDRRCNDDDIVGLDSWISTKTLNTTNGRFQLNE